MNSSRLIQNLTWVFNIKKVGYEKNFFHQDIQEKLTYIDVSLTGKADKPLTASSTATRISLLKNSHVFLPIFEYYWLRAQTEDKTH